MRSGMLATEYIMMGRPTMIRGMHRAFITAALSDSLANHGGFSGVAQVTDFVSA